MLILFIFLRAVKHLTFEDGFRCQHRTGTAKVCPKILQVPIQKIQMSLRFYHFYLWSKVAFDEKADTEEQREDVERGDYFGKVLVDLDREVRQEVDEEEVAGKRHEVELDSVG